MWTKRKLRAQIDNLERNLREMSENYRALAQKNEKLRRGIAEPRQIESKKNSTDGPPTYRVTITQPEPLGNVTLGAWDGCVKRDGQPIVAVESGVIVVRFKNEHGTRMKIVGAPMCTVVEEN